ncbi:NAD(P)H-dependent flavin oxidoreductase [Actinophytocola oryzae]|uniref:NAD(P)H-dependent flavin oxidoreductase n=1 Tax=Actinophytocola oryzae TaxID=502181 RepID=UPI001062AA06|nr:nitronate monooxygenase [Actinophytocola oryzae]
MIDELPEPIVQAPMAGGGSTPELAAAVSNAGGLGFLAAGYLTADAVRAQVDATRALTGRPFGLNVFVPERTPVDASAVEAYAAALRGEAERYGVPLGDPVGGDDAWEAKLALLSEANVPVVSFTFGCPSSEVIAEVKAHGCEVLVTVTSAAEAREAVASGADGLCVQGQEAGAHRGSFVNEGTDHTGLIPLLRKVSAAVDVPLVAAGGLSSGADVAAVLVAGASAAQLGTMFLPCPESGANPLHLAALAAGDTPTSVTRAFTGRPARGLVNRFLTEHSAAAPAAYPQVHQLTRDLRRAGDQQAMSLWAGQSYEFARPLPAAELVRELAAGARSALSSAARRWPA